jgi:hypothetical protein
MYVMFTDSRQVSSELKLKMKFLSCWGKKKVFLTDLNGLYLPMQLTA